MIYNCNGGKRECSTFGKMCLIQTTKFVEGCSDTQLANQTSAVWWKSPSGFTIFYLSESWFRGSCFSFGAPRANLRTLISLSSFPLHPFISRKMLSRVIRVVFQCLLFSLSSLLMSCGLLQTENSLGQALESSDGSAPQRA